MRSFGKSPRSRGKGANAAHLWHEDTVIVAPPVTVTPTEGDEDYGQIGRSFDESDDWGSIATAEDETETWGVLA